MDAGKTWTKLTAGLPGGMLGRIGLDISLKNPLVLYANVENANKDKMSDADRLKELREGKASAGMIGEEVYRTDDGGKTWRKVNEKNPVGGGPGYYYMDIRIDPADVNHAYVLSVGVLETKDGGKTWASAFRFGGDNHALWIDPKNSKHMILGYDHGMGITWDAGKTWYHPDELPLAQFYAVGYDMQVPYNVYGGLQDNGSVRGPSSKRGGRPIVFEDWQTVGGGDGILQRRGPHQPLPLQRVAVRVHLADGPLHGRVEEASRTATSRCATTGARPSSPRSTTRTSSTTRPTG